MSTAPIKAPTPKCRICGITAPDLVHEERPAGVNDAAERLGGNVSEYHCPDSERCRRMLRGQPLSDDRRFGNPEKVNPDDGPEPPLVRSGNVPLRRAFPAGPPFAHARGEPKAPAEDDDHEGNGVE